MNTLVKWDSFESRNKKITLIKVENAMIMRDFTLKKYNELCLALLDSGYTPLTVYSYLEGQKNKKLVVLRHDIDRKKMNALRMAELEHELGIQSTYYF